MNFNKMLTTFQETSKLLNDLTPDDFTFGMGRCIKTIKPKKIIESAIKTKKINGNVLYKVTLPNLYNDFDFAMFEFNKNDCTIILSEKDFKPFIKEYGTFDEAEIAACYINAVFSNAKFKKQIINNLMKIASDDDIAVIASEFDRMYGIANWNIPILTENVVEFKESDKSFLTANIKHLFETKIRYAFQYFCSSSENSDSYALQYYFGRVADE